MPKVVTERTYVIERDIEGRVSARVLVPMGGPGKALDPRLDLSAHSPDGFEVGYGGSGPAQLALAILADAFNDEIALRLYEGFKREIISKIRLKPGDRFTPECLRRLMLDACGLPASYQKKLMLGNGLTGDTPDGWGVPQRAFTEVAMDYDNLAHDWNRC